MDRIKFLKVAFYSETNLSVTSTLWGFDGVKLTDTFSFFLGGGDFVHLINFVHLVSFDQQGIIQIVRLNPRRYAVFAQTLLGILNVCFLVLSFVSVLVRDLGSFLISLTFRHRASRILGQAFHYSPENAFYIFNQQIYFII